MTAALNPNDYPQGFRVRGRPVGVTFAHAESFRPAYAASQFSFKSDNGRELLYWDDKAFVSIWDAVHGHLPKNGNAVSRTESTNDADADADADAFFASLDEPETATTEEPSRPANSEPLLAKRSDGPVPNGASSSAPRGQAEQSAATFKTSEGSSSTGATLAAVSSAAANQE